MHPIDVHFNATGALSGSDARLIWELVANISPPSQILGRHGLTPVDLKNKMRDKMFVAAYREVQQAWGSDLNVQQRIKIKAGLLLEDSLEDIILIIKDPLQSVANKLEATKQLGQLSQTINPKQAVAGEGSKFTVKINIGGDTKAVTIDGHALPALEAVAE